MLIFRHIRAIILPLLLLLPLSQLSAQEIVIGDSIACGVKDVGHLRGGCHIGASPLAVLHMVISYPMVGLADQVVVLSSGVSNNPAQVALVRYAVTYLRDHRAHVVLLGVGDRLPDSVGLNNALKFYAESVDGIFVWGWQDVHPGSYGEVLRVIREQECKAWRICGV